ncbi:hypothetical protein J2T38_002272 [Neisseria perflava]|uniref:hypothetical protein n=1 Tax=Neisseria perflava TaxID=33053 RepID=UPI0020A1E90F|nr:hypothetical protein [Neisseria perflava]MCP1773423.1 hypothetical protein [Neisseria perflava]
MATIFALALTSTQAEPLKFAWQQHHAQVTESGNNGQFEVKAHYSIGLEKQPDGNFLLSQSERQIISFNNQAPSKAITEMWQKVQPPSPKIIIDKQGLPVDIADWSSYYDDMLQRMGTQSSSKMNNQQISLLIKEKAMQEPWCYWVCSFVDQDPKQLPAPQTEIDTISGIPFIRSSEYRLIKQNKNEATIRYTVQLKLDEKNLIGKNLFGMKLTEKKTFRMAADSSKGRKKCRSDHYTGYTHHAAYRCQRC